MQFRVLGALEAWPDGGAAIELGPPKQRALLAALLLHVGEVLPVDRLIELLWGEDAPRTAAHSIQAYVSDLRRVLETPGAPSLIVTRAPGYVLEIERDAIDAWQFERLVRDGVRRIEAGDPEDGQTELRQALALWRGPALSEFAYEEFAQPYIRRLNETHLDAIEVLAATELDAGRATDVIPLLEAAVLEDPLRERSRELLMLALYRAGRHADALRTYDALRRQLADELGVDPSPSIGGLYDRILIHDPSLRPRSDASAAAMQARNPYKGLRAFTEQDAADFFGREDLVERLLDALAGDRRLVALVGPSGSGKSSVVAAGLVPRIRAGSLPGSERWRIARMTPGRNPLREAEAVVARSSGPGPGRAERSGLLAAAGKGGTLLLIDQFEQVFTVPDETARNAFLAAIAEAVAAPDGGLRVVLTLRADYYDRPLLHPGFAAAFGPGVVNVMPMSAQGLEAAVVEPARRAGVEIDPALLAELVADTTGRPGSLPLLQYALTELFDQRTGAVLTRAGYQALGGLRGLLSRQAERLYCGLDAEAQAAATQVFLRLVLPGNGAMPSRRRVTVAELSDLGLDPVVLSQVLGAFGDHRLLTYDRDPVSAQATVELAHEALLVEWERLAGWIDRHRAALRRHGALTAAAEEWELSARNPDYLLVGSRLEEFEPWLAGGALQLSGRERAFLQASVERRRSVEEAENARSAAQRRRDRQVRLRYAALAFVVVVLGSALAYAVLAASGSHATTVALLTNGEGTVDGIVEAAFDRAVTDFGLVPLKVGIHQQAAIDDTAWDRELRRLSQSKPALIIVFGYSDDAIGRDDPDVRYLLYDRPPGDLPNVRYVVFREWEGAYLVGAAAALTSETGTIGIVGGWDGPPIWGFVAGYTAGARAVDPGITVLSRYLTELGNSEAWSDPAAAEAEARRMYGQGADVVFGAAGTSGLGVFQAATDMSRERGVQLWAIGVDSDQYESVRHLSGVTQADAWRPHILTSMIKRFDLVTYEALKGVHEGTFTTTSQPFDLASGYLDISYNGGFLDAAKPRIEAYRQQIVSGAIRVPCLPDDRRAVAEALATEAGISFGEFLGLLCP